MIELWSEHDPHGRVRCQTRSNGSGGQCLRYQDHGGEHRYPPLSHPAEDEAEVALRHTSDIGLLRTFAALTHRLHVADRERTAAAPILRGQRDRVEAEILGRMRRE
jgi:hypothetical protein